ncbi:hypothetical protein [Niveibacterium sp. SC-1]|uniref:hypothetical protein n=1 Tax=Niveibacterium sp. SC-1 TaxID=3135646 RepID=UPI00311F2896
MGGVLFVAVVFLVLAAFFALTWRLGPPLQFMIVFAFLGVVVADSNLADRKLEQACENGLGVVVKSRAERVEGVRFAFRYSVDQGSAKDFGYRFVEAQGFSASELRVDRSTFVDGKEGMTSSTEFSANYALARDVSENGRLVEYTYSVREIDSGNELGRARWFVLRGAWVDRIIDNFSDGGPREFVATCHQGSEYGQMKALLHATLSPLES